MIDAVEAAGGNVRADPVELSFSELDVLREHLGMERLPLVLKVPSPGRTHAERRELVELVWRGLEERGLCGPGGLHERLERMLRMLVAPRHEVDGRCWFGRSVRVLAAGSGRSESDEAVVVTKRDEAVSLRPAAPTGLVREAVSAVLPAVPAGAGRSVTLPSETLDAAAAEAADDLLRLRESLRSRGLRDEDAETLARMLEGARSQGQFGVAVQRPRSGRRRAEQVVGFFDAERGRYTQLRGVSPSGELWTTVAPADQRGLIGRLESLLGELEQ
ncbi:MULTISPECIES: ESX secretion-associated protein EspG [Actinopolyspora]|uniref:EspG family protein n=1 Tax=Actinopolyspora saharensis TaxID=995062 RepID=A0A1H1EDW4_9ACTN|nr:MULTISPECIES: ESX secretion-associated protein EspG [Actinopolyspora]NHD19052.1 ESX secretion-associated protein EspG [Actinopolyspora sp. BKK2]NHE78163.1 ESX secretion-associated protein EspG [Actinopolyspora sp. BKK1]SDQ86942.1 EspG family protein [Actinopolyspora saharensis]